MNPHNRQSSVTAQDVAELAGVSRAVVSRALSNNGSISPDARARVLRAAEELGYQVNFLAQGLNRQRSHLIGVIVSRISDPFRSTLLDALLNEIQRQGFQALVSEIHSEQDLAQTLRRLEQDGLVVRTAYATVPPRVEYALTPLGTSFMDPMRQLVHWAAQHHEQVRTARQAYRPVQAAAPL